VKALSGEGGRVKRFWKREDDLEARLRAERPEPRPEFVRAVAAGIDAAPRRRSYRLAFAAALTALAIAAFGAVGGLGYAAKAVARGADEAVSLSQRGGNSIAANNNNNGNNNNGNNNNGNNNNGDDDEDDDTPAENQYKGKTTICHRTRSERNPFVLITVSNNALPAHQRHGDTLAGPGGTCPGEPIP
jgi:hypothetical protein